MHLKYSDIYLHDSHKSFKCNILEIPNSKIMNSYFLRNTTWIINSHGAWQLEVEFNDILDLKKDLETNPTL